MVVLAALGAFFACLWLSQELREGPREAPGKGSGSEFWCFFGRSGGRRLGKAENLWFYQFLLVFWTGFWVWFALSFCLRAMRAVEHETSEIMRKHCFCESKGIVAFFAEAAKDQNFRAAACRQEVEKRVDK